MVSVTELSNGLYVSLYEEADRCGDGPCHCCPGQATQAASLLLKPAASHLRWAALSLVSPCPRSRARVQTTPGGSLSGSPHLDL